MTSPIGFILVTHKNPKQIIRLVNKLNKMFDNPPIVCHHDFFKSALPIDTFSKNVSLVHPNLQTGWGSFSVVEATLRALKILYATQNSPDWFVLLSEADYPIKSANQILHDLASSPYDVHIHHEKINYNNYERDWQQLCFERYCTIRFRVPFLNKKLHLTKRTVSLRNPLLTAHFLPFSDKFHCFAGEHWFCANRKAAEYLIEFHSTQPALANHYRRLDSFTISPDESYYQTVFCNAPHLKVSNNIWRYIDWSTNGSSPKTLLFDDMPKIQASSAHFARKFDIDKDVKILNELDAILG